LSVLISNKLGSKNVLEKKEKAIKVYYSEDTTWNNTEMIYNKYERKINELDSLYDEQ